MKYTHKELKEQLKMHMEAQKQKVLKIIDEEANTHCINKKNESIYHNMLRVIMKIFSDKITKRIKEEL